MAPPNLADADAGGGDDLRPHVEGDLVGFNHDDDMPGLHQAEGAAGDVLVDVLQKLEGFLGVVQAGPQGGGVLQPHPGKAGYAHAHTVFVDAGVDLHLDGDNVSPHGVIGVGGGQGHADGLGTPQGGGHLLPQQGQQLFLGNHETHSLSIPVPAPIISKEPPPAKGVRQPPKKTGTADQVACRACGVLRNTF